MFPDFRAGLTASPSVSKASVVSAVTPAILWLLTHILAISTPLVPVSHVVWRCCKGLSAKTKLINLHLVREHTYNDLKNFVNFFRLYQCYCLIPWGRNTRKSGNFIDLRFEHLVFRFWKSIDRLIFLHFWSLTSDDKDLHYLHWTCGTFMRNIWNNNTALSDYYPYSDNTNKFTVTVYSSAIC